MTRETFLALTAYRLRTNHRDQIPGQLQADYFETPDDPYVEDLNSAGTWLIELVAAVGSCAAATATGSPSGRLEEAVRLWVAERVSTVHGVGQSPTPTSPNSPGLTRHPSAGCSRSWTSSLS